MSDPRADRAVAGRDGAAETDDEALLRRVRAHDEAALAALYDRHAGLVFTVALRVLGDRALAEEVLQDTFLRCWQGAETYQPGRGHVAGWLLGIARNRAIDALRSRSHQARLREGAPLPGDETGAAPRATGTEDAVALREAVGAALAGLPAAQRRVVELAYYGGLTQGEIARQLGEPLGTVKTRTRAAMGRLRDLLRPHL